MTEETRIKLTQKRIVKLPVPTNKTITYHDLEKTGLKLTISVANTRTFFIYRKIQGKPERIKIGNYPTVSVEFAKKEADKINALIAQGKNPNEIRRSKRKELTLEELFTIYINKHARPRKKTCELDELNYKNHLKHWGNRKISSIRAKDIENLHLKIGDKHPYQANRILSLIKIIFNKAIKWKYFNDDNPAVGIEPFPEYSRDRYLRKHELEGFFKSVAAETNRIIADYILISLLTGARSANVKSMEWNEICFEEKEWKIPKTKNDSALTVTLNELAILILNSRKNKNQFVFPGSGKTGHLVEPKKGWKRIKKRAELEDLRMHDLRRTLGSWLANTGASLKIISDTLGHKDLKTSEIYARLALESIRERVDIATSEIMKAGNINIDDFSEK